MHAAVFHYESNTKCHIETVCVALQCSSKQRQQSAVEAELEAGETMPTAIIPVVQPQLELLIC